MQIRIAILANKDLSKLAKKLAFGYSKLSKSYFWVDGKKLAHHITLFDILSNTKNLKTAGATIIKAIGNKSAIKLSASGLWKSRNGYLGLSVKHTKELLNFRRKLFKAMGKYKPQSIKKRYNAHITLTRYPDKNFAYKNKIANPLKKAFYFSDIIFAKVDKHGQVYKIIKKFKLK